MNFTYQELEIIARALQHYSSAVQAQPTVIAGGILKEIEEVADKVVKYQATVSEA